MQRVNVLLSNDIDLSSITEIDLNALLLAAPRGPFKKGFLGWYLMREEKVLIEGYSLPALWANPSRMFVGTLEEAYRFLEPATTGRVFVTMTSFDDLSVQPQEYCLDAVTGEALPLLSNHTPDQPTFEDFMSSLQVYK